MPNARALIGAGACAVAGRATAVVTAAPAAATDLLPAVGEVLHAERPTANAADRRIRVLTRRGADNGMRSGTPETAGSDSATLMPARPFRPRNGPTDRCSTPSWRS